MFIRKFTTGSGATGVQVVRKEHGKIVETIHVGSASSPERLERLLKKARDLMEQGRAPLFNLKKYEKSDKEPE
jgi:2,4-dienoyl-CoA reductase-like NADH-dependent reductase (Old Yellow Enzyme family)